MSDLPKRAYTRQEVRRLLKVSERQLKSWERQDLVAAREEYGFEDLLALRTLARLREAKIPPKKIRLALEALAQKIREVDNPLTELKIYTEGKGVRVQYGRQTMEPVSGQLLLNFEAGELAKLLAFPPAEKKDRQSGGALWAQTNQMFQRALELEQQGDTEEAIRAYQQVLDADPDFAGALVNLGTIYFSGRELDKAEEYYQRAVATDPNYALAHFNLGNLNDELGRRNVALEHYRAALDLNPNYADAHYNIALLYQSSGQALRAVRHWKTYLKLDPTSPWAMIAKRELERLYRETVVQSTENS